MSGPKRPGPSCTTPRSARPTEIAVSPSAHFDLDAWLVSDRTLEGASLASTKRYLR